MNADDTDLEYACLNRPRRRSAIMAAAAPGVERDTGADDQAAALERIERPLLVKRAIQARRERKAAARLDRDAIALYARASAGALEYLRMFQIGRELSAHPGPDEVVGKQLSVMFPGRVPLTAKAARLDRLNR
jgi:hypothetical protein